MGRRFRGRTGLSKSQVATGVGVHLRVRSVHAWDSVLSVASTDRLQSRIGVLLIAGGLATGGEMAQAARFWLLIEYPRGNNLHWADAGSPSSSWRRRQEAPSSTRRCSRCRQPLQVHARLTAPKRSTRERIVSARTCRASCPCVRNVPVAAFSGGTEITKARSTPAYGPRACPEAALAFATGRCRAERPLRLTRAKHCPCVRSPPERFTRHLLTT
jgi:hypothetical protein